MAKKQIKHPAVDEVFSSLLRPLTDQEYQRLEASQVAAKRILEDLDIWHDLVVDGHHRLKVAKEHDLPYGVNVLDPNWTREQVITHIFEKHIGRRNFTKEQYEEMVAKYYEALKKQHGDASRFEQNQIEHLGEDPKKTREKAAEQFGISESSVVRAVDRTALRDSLEESLRRTLDGAKKKVTDDQLRALAAMSAEQQVMAAEQIRKFSQTIDDAVKLASGKSVKTLAGAGAKKPRNGKPAKKPKPRDDAAYLVKQWAGMVKTLDTLMKRCDELVNDKLLTRAAAKPVIAELDKPRKMLWGLAHPKAS